MTARQRKPEPTASLPALPDSDTRHALHHQLLAWFARHARDLPWRRTRNPYHILVAEIMLQQTQVDRVLPKYAAFLAAFPTLHDLAAAPTAEVIQQWAGLGYNRRAVNLQRSARAICSEHGGEFPRTVEELQRLPGIGPYTAGAVACFAFEQDVAFMDTNIRRVLRRLLVGPDTAPPPPDRELLTLGQALIPAGQGWAWNQALMELGALLCTAAAPACWRCPLNEHCHAYAEQRRADETVFARMLPDGTTELPPDDTAPAARPARRIAEQAAPFVGSNRYYRGRLIAALRELPPGTGLTLAQVGPRLKADFHPPDDMPWLHTLSQGLARDGLIEIVDDTVSLPTT
jgi:A/G-specific adenine glycosylase